MQDGSEAPLEQSTSEGVAKLRKLFINCMPMKTKVIHSSITENRSDSA